MSVFCKLNAIYLFLDNKNLIVAALFQFHRNFDINPFLAKTKSSARAQSDTHHSPDCVLVGKLWLHKLSFSVSSYIARRRGKKSGPNRSLTFKRCFTGEELEIRAILAKSKDFLILNFVKLAQTSKMASVYGSYSHGRRGTVRRQEHWLMMVVPKNSFWHLLSRQHECQTRNSACLQPKQCVRDW